MSYKSIVLKKKITLLYFCLTFFCGFSQTKIIDSLKQELAKNNVHDTLKIDSYLGLSKIYLGRDMDSCYIYAKKGLNRSLKNNDYRLASIYNNMALYHIDKIRQDSALYYLDQGLKELNKHDDKLVRATIYSNYVLVYQASNEFDKKIEYNLKAINLMADNPYEVSRLHINQTIMYAQADLIGLSKKHLKEGYNTSKLGKNKLMEGYAIQLLGHFAIQEKKLDSAEIYLKRGLEICSEIESPAICYEMTSKLGELYGDLGKFKESDKYLSQAMEYALAIKIPYNILAVNTFLAKNEIKKGNYNKAVTYFKEFDLLYLNNEIPSLGVITYESWSDVEEKLGNFKKSNMLLKKYVMIKDSVFSQDNRAILADADAKYEREKKDKELSEQNLRLEQQENELQKKKIQYSYMTGAALVLLVSSILLWFLYQQRQKRKNQEIITLKREQQVQTLESLMEGEEKERIRISKELHDGVNVDLSAIKYKLTSMLEKNNEVINEVVTMIDKSCEQVRAISHNLVPQSLKDFSLIETIEDFCVNTNSIHNPEISFNHIGEAITISKKAEVNIFRIVQELVNNSIKHAEATEINVQISKHNNNIQLTVEDNGKGFVKGETESNGIGLQNIQSRVDYLSAKLDFSSNEKGTSYIIDINTEALT